MAKRIEDYLRISEAADLLGVSRQTLRNWEEKGKLRVFRHPMNGYRLFLKRDVEKLLEEIERSAASNRNSRRGRRGG